jgi:hypothetical protein
VLLFVHRVGMKNVARLGRFEFAVISKKRMLPYRARREKKKVDANLVGQLLLWLQDFWCFGFDMHVEAMLIGSEC